MARERIERRLAAILSADVAGYSRLMSGDEAGTLTALKALRKELFAPKDVEHHGRGDYKTRRKIESSGIGARSLAQPAEPPPKAPLLPLNLMV